MATIINRLKNLHWQLGLVFFASIFLGIGLIVIAVLIYISFIISAGVQEKNIGYLPWVFVGFSFILGAYFLTNPKGIQTLSGSGRTHFLIGIFYIIASILVAIFIFTYPAYANLKNPNVAYSIPLWTVAGSLAAGILLFLAPSILLLFLFLRSYFSRSISNEISTGKEAIMSKPSDVSDLEEIEKRILLAIIAEAIAQKTKSLKINIEGLRLKALVREGDVSQVQKSLDSLAKKQFLNSTIIEEEFISVELSTSLNLPNLDTDKHELVTNNAIRRALLFKLYEGAIKTGYRQGTVFPLIQLTKQLQVEAEQKIRMNVLYLRDKGYLEYPYADGGDCTSYLTVQGYETAEVTERLTLAFPTIDFNNVERSEEVAKSSDIEVNKNVFVVHGRNLKARKAMFDFLLAIGLHPIEWTEAIRMTGEISPYIGKVLDVAFANAQAIVVLLTGDDMARLGTRYTDNGKPDEILTPQARANVIFEAGLAFGRDPKRTVLVEMGNLREISDLSGRHTVRMDNSAERRQELASRLRSAGCDVQTDGKTHWLSSGDFNGAVEQPDK